MDTAKVADHVDRLPHSLLGWVGADGLPMVTRVRSTGVDASGVRLAAIQGPLPPGGRRGGLTAHLFQQHMVGQEQRVHTGWLEVDGDDAVYAPHTKSGQAIPASRLLFAVGAGIGMQPGSRQARRHGLTQSS